LEYTAVYWPHKSLLERVASARACSGAWQGLGRRSQLRKTFETNNARVDVIWREGTLSASSLLGWCDGRRCRRTPLAASILIDVAWKGAARELAEHKMQAAAPE
jgi:hypothetical protein